MSGGKKPYFVLFLTKQVLYCNRKEREGSTSVEEKKEGKKKKKKKKNFSGTQLSPTDLKLIKTLSLRK